MKSKKLMPIDAEPGQLIDWMEKGAYNALWKKSNGAADVTANQMRSSVCIIVWTLVQLVRTLDRMPEERIDWMKLQYYDDVTPTEYEPPFFISCSEQEANTQWSKNPLKMDVGDVNSKHLILALNVKSILDPCGEASKDLQGKGMVNLVSQDDFDVAPVGKEHSSGEHVMVNEDETEDVESARQLALVKKWISAHYNDSLELTDVLSTFPDISMTLTEELIAKVVNEGVISRVGGDTYAIRKIQDVESHVRDVKEQTDAQETPDFKMMKKTDEDYMHMKALYHALPMDYVSVPKRRVKLDGEANQVKLIDQMAQDGYLEGKNTRQLGKRVVHSDLTAKKLLEVQIALKNNSKEMEIEEPQNRPSGLDHLKKGSNNRDTSTCGGLHSIGWDLTRTQGKSHIQHNDSLSSEQAEGIKQEQPAPSQENIATGNERTHSDGGSTRCSTQDQGARKASVVKEPILQNSKCQQKRIKESSNVDVLTSNNF